MYLFQFPSGSSLETFVGQFCSWSSIVKLEEDKGTSAKETFVADVEHRCKELLKTGKAPKDIGLEINTEYFVSMAKHEKK